MGMSTKSFSKKNNDRENGFAAYGENREDMPRKSEKQPFVAVAGHASSRAPLTNCST
jgi:hypothetical protein